MLNNKSVPFQQGGNHWISTTRRVEILLDAVTCAMSCQHEQSFYQSDEGTEGFEEKK